VTTPPVVSIETPPAGEWPLVTTPPAISIEAPPIDDSLPLAASDSEPEPSIA
jgi:hypothetical protein